MLQNIFASKIARVVHRFESVEGGVPAPAIDHILSAVDRPFNVVPSLGVVGTIKFVPLAEPVSFLIPGEIVLISPLNVHRLT